MSTIGGIDLVSDTTEPGLQTVDQLGLRLATLANSITGIDAIYNDQTDQVVLESVQKHRFYSSGKSNWSAQALRLQAPSTVQIVRSATRTGLLVSVEQLL